MGKLRERRLLRKQKRETEKRKLSDNEAMTLDQILGYKPFPAQIGWAKWAFDDKAKVKLFLGARGYGKSESVIFWGVTQKLKENPNLTFILRTRQYSRGKEVLATLSEIMNLMGFHGSFLKTQIRLSDNIGKKKQPTVKLMTTASVTKGNHADYLIDDDPIDPVRDVGSEAMKSLVLRAFKDAQNISKFYICITQFVEENDIASYISGLENVRGNDSALLSAWHGTIPELDINKEDFLNSGNTLRDWGLNYEGVFYKSDTLIFDFQPDDFFDENINMTNCLAMWIDPSYSMNGDYTSVTVGKVINGILYVKGFSFRNVTQMYSKIQDIILKHSPRRILYDASKDYEGGMAHNIRSLLPWVALQVVPIPHESEKKEIKIIANIHWALKRKKIKIQTSSDIAYIDGVVHYSGDPRNHDDHPDSLACLIREIKKAGLMGA